MARLRVRNGRRLQDRLPTHPRRGPIDDDLTPHLRGVYPSEPAGPAVGRRRATAADLRAQEAEAREVGHIESARRGGGGHRRSPARRLRLLRPVSLGMPEGGDLQPAPDHARANARPTRGFRYVPGRLVLSLLSGNKRISASATSTRRRRRFARKPCDVVFLAAGALQTGAIFLRTLKAARAEIALETEGLMDTTVVKIPFVCLRGIGQPPDPRVVPVQSVDSGHDSGMAPWPRYLHGELLHLTSLLYYPLIERMPFDSRLSKKLFFALRSALGVATLFFPDRITPATARCSSTMANAWDNVRLAYRETAEKERLHSAIGFQRCGPPCGDLGCVPKRRRPVPSGRGSTTPEPCRWATGRSDAIPTGDPTFLRISTSPTARLSRRCPASRSRCRWPPTPPACANGAAWDERGDGAPAFPLWQIDPQEYDAICAYLG